MPSQDDKSLTEKGFAGLLLFVVGFAGFALLGAIVFFILISLGILPALFKFR